jgi:hypothetical protein
MGESGCPLNPDYPLKTTPFVGASLLAIMSVIIASKLAPTWKSGLVTRAAGCDSVNSTHHLLYGGLPAFGIIRAQ